jgi:hypothetical protein
MAPFREEAELPTDRKCSTHCNPRCFSRMRRRIVGDRGRDTGHPGAPRTDPDGRSLAHPRSPGSRA